jgi:hypothetical protein
VSPQGRRKCHSASHQNNNNKNSRTTGLHPFVFKNSASKAVSYAQTAHKLATGLGLFGVAIDNKTADRASVASPRPDSKPGAEPLAVISTASSTSTSNQAASSSQIWNKWAPAALYGLGGAVAAGAAFGAAYYRRDDLTSGIGWAGDHLKYVGNLWDDNALKLRVNSLMAIGKESGIVFRK